MAKRDRNPGVAKKNRYKQSQSRAKPPQGNGAFLPKYKLDRVPAFR